MVLASSTARLRGDERSFDSPRARKVAPTHKTSFVAGLARAGYTDISVDEIIALKEHGVSPQYMLSITGAGIGRPSPQELIQLHERGVDARHVEQARDLGLASLSVDRLIQLKDSGILSGKGHKR
jgi:hypothetical protein